MTTVYAGTSVQTTGTFTNVAGSLTDPTTITLKYAAGSAATVTLTYAGNQITRVSTGVYQVTLDTTASAGQWQVQATAPPSR